MPSKLNWIKSVKVKFMNDWNKMIRDVFPLWELNANYGFYNKPKGYYKNKNVDNEANVVDDGIAGVGDVDSFSDNDEEFEGDYIVNASGKIICAD